MRKALKTVLCVALILALTAIVALRVLPPMDTPAQSAAATPTPVVTAAPTPTPEPDNGLPKVNTGSWELTLVNAQNPIGEAVPGGLGGAGGRAGILTAAPWTRSRNSSPPRVPRG